MLMVRSEEKRSLRPASCCSVEVMNGGYGRRVYGFCSTEDTDSCAPLSPSTRAPVLAWSSTTTSAGFLTAPTESKSRPVATRRPSTLTRRALNTGGCALGSETLASSSATMSQYSALRNAIRSRSRCTMIRVATDWTRPALSFGATFFHSTGETS